MEGKEDQDPFCDYWFSAELTYFNKVTGYSLSKPSSSDTVRL